MLRRSWHELIPQFARVLAIVPIVLVFWGCGGGGSSQTNSTPASPTPQVSNVPMEVNIGDAPSDRVIAFATSISSMILTNSAGGTVSVVSTSTPLEMMHLAGTMQPLAMINIPQATYNSATIVIGTATVTYMDPVSQQSVQKTVSGMTATINFSPAITISGTTPLIMDFDMNIASSVSIDASGNVTLTPTFHMNMGTFGSGGGLSPEQGGMQHVFGSVASFSGNSFTMSLMQGAQNFSFATNSSTHFENMSGMGMMSNGMLVAVDAVMQSDGSMLAQDVRSIMAGGQLMGGGVMTGVSGNPPTQLTIMAQNGAGSGMMASFLANGIAVNVTNSTPYIIDSDEVDTSNLPFTPTFNNSTLFKGQRIHAITGQSSMGGGMGGMMVASMNASEIDLEQQCLVGTVSAYTQTGSQTSFTLNMAPDSAFTTLTGSTSVTVFQQTGTTLVGLNSVANGNTVEARGLLFLDAGVYKLVASRIVAP